MHIWCTSINTSGGKCIKTSHPFYTLSQSLQCSSQLHSLWTELSIQEEHFNAALIISKLHVKCKVWSLHLLRNTSRSPILNNMDWIISRKTIDFHWFWPLVLKNRNQIFVDHMYGLGLDSSVKQHLLGQYKITTYKISTQVLVFWYRSTLFFYQRKFILSICP